MEDYDPKPVATSTERGCLFYGCITLVVVTILGLIAIGVGVYLLTDYISRTVLPFTQEFPVELPQVQLDPESESALAKRWDEFRQNLKNPGTNPTRELDLSADELNHLIQTQPALRDKVRLSIVDGRIRAEVSLPLDGLPLPGLSGRYLNGVGEVTASMEDGVLIVRAVTLEANGKSATKDLLDSLGKENLAKDLYRDADQAEMLRTIERVEVKEGKLRITLRDLSKEAEDARKVRQSDEPPTKEEAPALKPGEKNTPTKDAA